MNPSEKLAKFRRDNKLTQADMSKRLGLKTQQAYSYYENLGTEFDQGKAMEFGSILGINLLDDSDPQNEYKNNKEADKEKALLYEIKGLQKKLIEDRNSENLIDHRQAQMDIQFKILAYQQVSAQYLVKLLLQLPGQKKTEGDLLNELEEDLAQVEGELRKGLQGNRFF